MRWRRVTATLPAVVGWMIEGQETHVTCVQGLPPGTVCVGSLQEDVGRASLIVEHPSFEDVQFRLNKDLIPQHPDPTFRTVGQQGDALEARWKQQLQALANDLGLVILDTPESARVQIRNAFGQLQDQLKEAKTALLPLQDELAALRKPKP